MPEGQSRAVQQQWSARPGHTAARAPRPNSSQAAATGQSSAGSSHRPEQRRQSSAARAPRQHSSQAAARPEQRRQSTQGSAPRPHSSRSRRLAAATLSPRASAASALSCSCTCGQGGRRAQGSFHMLLWGCLPACLPACLLAQCLSVSVGSSVSVPPWSVWLWLHPHPTHTWCVWRQVCVAAGAPGALDAPGAAARPWRSASSAPRTQHAHRAVERAGSRARGQ
jgi:hypothetical protein